MMEKKSMITINDIPLRRLVPTNKKFPNGDLARVRRSMEAIEMLEPLVVCAKGETFLISDGNKRYRILCDAGIESAPCVLIPHIDTYTASRQVIDVSATEREKMINKVREKVTEDKVAAAIGIASLTPSIDKSLVDKLHQVIKLAFENKILSKTALQELKNVTPKRQAEILRELNKMKNYSLDMIKGMIINTPPAEQIAQKKKTPWQKSDEKRVWMTKQLQEIEKQNSHLEGLFHTYVLDVLEQVTYIRGLLDHVPIKQYIIKNYPDKYKKICEIIDRT